MDATPLYSNAPIAVVLLEVRHPLAELSSPAMTLLKTTLREHTPIERTETNVEFNIQTGERKASTFRKLVSRDIHTAVTFRPDAVVVETTNYLGWKWFRAVAEAALRARQEVAPVDGVERVGLRYVDEIRVPQNTTPVDWADWVSGALLGPKDQVAALNLQMEQQQSVVQYRSPLPGHTFTLRYGAARGAVVQSTENLRRPKEPDGGEFFLIDTDGAWVDTSGGIPEFDVDSILSVCDEIHSPIKRLFESLITDKLRSEVLNNAD